MCMHVICMIAEPTRHRVLFTDIPVRSLALATFPTREISSGIKCRLWQHSNDIQNEDKCHNSIEEGEVLQPELCVVNTWPCQEPQHLCNPTIRDEQDDEDKKGYLNAIEAHG